MEKPWYLSKTIWANVLTALVGVSTLVAGWEFVPASVVVVITGVIIPMLNIGLRFVTTMGIALFKRGGNG